MTISAPRPGSLQIHTKSANITLGDNVQIGDFVIDAPGEYDVSGVEVFGVGKLFIIEAEDMRLAYLDKLNRSLSNAEQEAASDVDILFVPVGGDEVLDAKGALAVISQLDPRIVIPMHYENIDEFTKDEGVTPEFVDSLKVTRQNLPETERKVVVLPWKPSKKS